MDFIDQLAAQRRKFIDGLDANEGDINLDIFEDFYPDEAHFLFELLQNAEDAGATSVRITLHADRCRFEHNGSRAFTRDDMRSITGIHNSTKSKQPDMIGKFGVGFKSVFVYTIRPVVHSETASFAITQYVLPERVAAPMDLDRWTRFDLPFDNPRKASAEAFAEIRGALAELPPTTLLYLPNLNAIEWQVVGGGAGRIRRVQHAENHFEVTGFSNGAQIDSTHFLRFEEPVEGLEKLSVAIAFSLDFLPGTTTFDPTKPLAEQLRIVPASPGHVAVFFPAEKETSGLRFHLHAPFVPELSRASIKETEANDPLFRQLARLSSASLHRIRDLGLLTVDFLAVMPNPHDQLPERYQGIRDAIVEEMNTQPLTPTQARGHAPAERLLQAKASLKELLSRDDLEFLVDHDDGTPGWAANAPQKNSNSDRFLSSLAIATWDLDEFVTALSSILSDGRRWSITPPHWRTGPNTESLAWIGGHTIDWHQRLYALFHAELGAYMVGLHLKNSWVVRRIDGSYGTGKSSYFPNQEVEDDGVLPRVDPGTYSTGKSKQQRENAKAFLTSVGVREIGEAEQVEAILKQRYTKDAEIPARKVYWSDLRRFMALVEADKDQAEMFEDYYIFEATDGWRQPTGIFLDVPFRETGLSAYYTVLGKDADRQPLSEVYQTTQVSLKRLTAFASAVGAQDHLEVSEVSCSANPERSYLYAVAGDRFTSPIDRDYAIRNLEPLLSKPSIQIAKLIWRTMTALPPHHLQAVYQKNRRWGCRRADSQLVRQLRNAEWVPQTDGRFVKAPEASRELLPEGFAFDAGWTWIQALQFGAETIKRTEEVRHRKDTARALGFDDLDCLERAKQFVALPLKDQIRILDELQRGRLAELPDDEPRDPGRRSERVGAEAAKAPERISEERTRAVSIGQGKVKEAARAYLVQQYKANDVMICQICKDTLPFKLDDGTDYFEAIPLPTELKRLHYQNYLALCPNHAAMFDLTNGSAELMREMIEELGQNELELILAQRKETVYFTKKHILDLKTVIGADSEVGAEPDVEIVDEGAPEDIAAVIVNRPPQASRA